MKKLTFFILIITISLRGFAQIPTDSLVLYLPFNGNAIDESGNGYNGVVNGATLVKDRFWQNNSAYYFDGVDDYINLSDYVSNFNFGQPATFSFWIKTLHDNSRTIFSLTDGIDGGNRVLFIIGNNSTGTMTDEIATVAYINSSEYYIAGVTSSDRSILFDNDWHHIVYVFDGVETKITIDNVLYSLTCNYGVNNGNYGNVINASNFILGAKFEASLTGFHNGYLDDVRIYNKVLTSNEIEALYNEPYDLYSDTTYITVYDSISVTDTLIIDVLLTSVPSPNNINTVKVYPNPTSSFVIINTGDYASMSNYNLKIVNTLGQTVFENLINEPEFQIDVNTFGANGTYFVNIYDDLGTLKESRKLILQ